MNGTTTWRRLLELAETMLEQVVRAVEVRAQAPDGARAVPARERVLPRGAEELPVDAHQQPRSDSRVPLVGAELGLDRLGQHLHESRHHLELLGQQRRRLLDDAREGREAGTAEA